MSQRISAVAVARILTAKFVIGLLEELILILKKYPC